MSMHVIDLGPRTVLVQGTPSPIRLRMGRGQALGTPCRSIQVPVGSLRLETEGVANGLVGALLPGLVLLSAPCSSFTKHPTFPHPNRPHQASCLQMPGTVWVCARRTDHGKWPLRSYLQHSSKGQCEPWDITKSVGCQCGKVKKTNMKVTDGSLEWLSLGPGFCGDSSLEPKSPTGWASALQFLLAAASSAALSGCGPG